MTSNRSITRFERDGKYSRYDAKGNDDPVWKGKSIVDLLLPAVILDGETTPEMKERATTILSHVARKRKWASLHPELDAYEGILRIDAGALWDFYPEWEIFTDKDGVECVRKIGPQEIVTSPTEKASEPEPNEVEPEQKPDEPLTGAQKLAAAKAEVRGLL
jgi:hypothetical protein